MVEKKIRRARPVCRAVVEEKRIENLGALIWAFVVEGLWRRNDTWVFAYSIYYKDKYYTIKQIGKEDMQCIAWMYCILKTYIPARTRK